MKTKNMTIPNWCGKFVSALAVLSVFMFGTSCNDEEFADSARKPLQLSVTANAPLVSRAIINDTYLPDGSQIGVTLTATDGSAYDNQDFYNLAYTASGTGAEQVWSSATPASLSTTSGKVIAYYPYNGSEELDLTAIPVETASQTDYMYAKPVTGIDFSSADINLNMQHAMTDIRINLKKGTYTGTGDVTKVTVKAAAFATSATMDAETGVFANVSGSGAQFVQEFTELTLTTTASSQDFLMVPDTKSTSGEVSILTIIDGKKFAVTVPYTECFQQGYSYVYNLTLDNSGLVLEGVDVTKWSVKVKEEQELEFYDNQYIVKIEVPSDGYKYIHNIWGASNCIVDWGDGTKTDYTNMTNCPTSPSHTYEKAGEYIVTLSVVNSINLKIDSYDSKASKIITELISIGKELNVNMERAFQNQTKLYKIHDGALRFQNNANMYLAFGYCEALEVVPDKLFAIENDNLLKLNSTFSNCEKLKVIPKEFFSNCKNITSFEGTFEFCLSLQVIPHELFKPCPEVTNFNNTFRDCTNLQAIPVGLFDYNTKVTSFDRTFWRSTNITTIPKGLFDKCTEVTSFDSTFDGYSIDMKISAIPEGLFDYNTKVVSFNGTFGYCPLIQTIPVGLFDNNILVQDFNGTFGQCDKINNIPEGLFDKCPDVTTFESVFYNTNISVIPEGLFDNNTKVTSFAHVFGGCDNISVIPEGLFDNCPDVTSFAGTFKGTNINNIPSYIFKNNTKVTSFAGTFNGCTALQTIPEGLFDKCTEVTTFAGAKSDYENSYTSGTFAGCDGLQTIPTGLFDKCTKVTTFNGLFQGSDNLQTIPVGLFDKCTEVTNFQAAFNGCKKLSSIPGGLFDYNTKVTSFSETFRNCTSLQAIPEGLFDKCTEVTNFYGAFWGTGITSIPGGLFDYNTVVTKFERTFAGCTSLQSIPTGLFDNNTKVTNFGYTFYNCSNLTGESPYTIINVDGEDVKVHLYERTNHSSYFTKPTTYYGCFEACTGLTDYSAIPSSWL